MASKTWMTNTLSKWCSKVVRCKCFSIICNKDVKKRRSKGVSPVSRTWSNEGSTPSRLFFPTLCISQHEVINSVITPETRSRQSETISRNVVASNSSTPLPEDDYIVFNIENYRSYNVTYEESPQANNNASEVEKECPKLRLGDLLNSSTVPDSAGYCDEFRPSFSDWIQKDTTTLITSSNTISDNQDDFTFTFTGGGEIPIPIVDKSLIMTSKTTDLYEEDFTPYLEDVCINLSILKDRSYRLTFHQTTHPDILSKELESQDDKKVELNKHRSRLSRLTSCMCHKWMKCVHNSLSMSVDTLD